MTIIASIHRFRDKVAVFTGDGPTAYLTPEQAKQLAKADGMLNLINAAQDPVDEWIKQGGLL